METVERPAVTCLFTGSTFPNGEASNSRVLMIGKALQASDFEFDIVINSEGNKNPLNKQIQGRIHDIPFTHVNGSMTIGLSKPVRIFNFIKGIWATNKKIRQLAKKEKGIVYLYSQGSLYNAWVSLYAHLCKVPVVQEVNEWSAVTNQGKVKSWIYDRIMFRWAKGAIVISTSIEKKIAASKTVNKELKITSVPVLADKMDWKGKAGHATIERNFVWCGMIESYIKDVEFMIRSMALMHPDYPSYRLVICGKTRHGTEQRIKDLCLKYKLPREAIVLTGYISDEQLITYCKTATALLVPLWDDQRSMDRFPTKIASFLFSARPVITCPIGEVAKYLAHLDSAVFYAPADPQDLREKMEYAILNQQQTANIGQKGFEVAAENFDYRSYSGILSEFFSQFI